MRDVSWLVGGMAVAFSAGCASDVPTGADPGAEPAFAVIADADHGGRPLATTLTGTEEAPGPGDPDGTGTALITLNQGQREVCFELAVEDIAAATAAHIHIAPPGSPGAVVVPLQPPTSGFSSGCVSDVDAELIKAIRQNPAAYYVNVHNADFPAGAVRGQLSK